MVNPRRSNWLAPLSRLLLDLVMVVLMLLVIVYLGDVRSEQREGKQRGYASRAQSCKVQVALGVDLDAQCLDPAVVAYYDPNAEPTAGARSEGQRRNRDLLCSILESTGRTSTDCVDVDEGG